MLLPMKTLLSHAKKHRYGIGAFNIINIDQAHITIQCAETLNSPVIIQIAELHTQYIDFHELVEYLQHRIKRSHVPIALHLDHGNTFDGIMDALHKGFSSVMIDASQLEYESNIEKTREIVDICHAMGVTVEAELGHIGEEGGFQGKAEREFFTDPNSVQAFVARTHIDALAISFGNVHGFYQGEPQLDFELLHTIAGKTSIPLVLHGGSGISAEDFRRAISLGICKINFFAYVEDAILRGMRESQSHKTHVLAHTYMDIRTKVEQVIKDHIRMFGSDGKCRGPYMD